MKIDNSLLAPYGSMKLARLATKVGLDPKITKLALAPYGSMKFARLGTKVGQPKIDKQDESLGIAHSETSKPSK
jgi:hypothetical protein